MKHRWDGTGRCVCGARKLAFRGEGKRASLGRKACLYFDAQGVCVGGRAPECTRTKPRKMRQLELPAVPRSAEYQPWSEVNKKPKEEET